MLELSSRWRNNLPRVYHIDVAQYVTRADARWVDNLISRFSLPGVEGAGRGASRRLTETAIQHIALISVLSADLGLPLTLAVPLAESLLSGTESELAAGAWIRFTFKRAEFLQHIDGLIAEGVEALTPTRRGRPPASARSLH